MSTLNKQVWVSQLLQRLYPDTSFLNYVRDFSALVDNDKINLADCGVDPAVLVNNTTYPIAVNPRADTPLEITLDLLETENTLVRRPEVIEYAYDQLESVLMGHRNSLRAKAGVRAAHAYSPTGDTANTPVIDTTGADDGEGNKRLTIPNILKLKRRYDDMLYPFDGRFLVLCPRHIEDLILEDTKAFKDITDLQAGQPKRFAGFSILQTTQTATYNRTTGLKKPLGAVTAPSDGFSSFAFFSDEVMKADGPAHMYARTDDPEQRATIVGFDKRFVAVPLRNRGIGAIVSAAV